MPGSLTLILSASQRQASEMFNVAVVSLFAALGWPVPSTQESALSLKLANGSRVVSLPSTENTTRGYASVGLLLCDESARLPDPLYEAMRPVLSVSGGRLVALSSAYWKRGWFYRAATGAGPWERYTVRAEDCPRIDPAFLAEERAELGDVIFDREYRCVFSEAEGSLLRQADIDRSLDNDVRPLWAEGAA